jgi:protein TonB
VAVPRYRNNPAPEYPVAAKRRREEGEVRLSVTVSPDGRPLRVSLFRSSGHALLDQAAMDAVQRWEPVEDRVVVPVRFSLSRQ